MNSITLGEIADAVTKLSIRKVLIFVGKWYLILQVIQFTLAFAFITYLSLSYPERILAFTQHGIMPWEEVAR